MKIQATIFMILVAITSSSCHPPTRRILEPCIERLPRNHSVTGTEHVSVAHRAPHSILRTRMKSTRSGEVSLSPESTPLPYYTRADNSTKTNTTLPIQQSSLKIPSWVPTLENIITPIFRTVILILTLFNVNITWRLHGQWLPSFVRSCLHSNLIASQPFT